MSSSRVVVELLPQLDAAGLEKVIAEMILFVGMAALTALHVPPRVEGVSWDECFERGLGRINAMGRDALDRERGKV